MMTAAGCTQQERIVRPELKSEQMCIVKHGENEYGCKLQFLGSNVEGITIESPSSLKGMTFRSSAGKYSLSYGSLICKSDRILLPESSFPVKLMKVMQQMRKKQDDIILTESGNDYVYSENDGLGYRIVADENGNIKAIQI